MIDDVLIGVDAFRAASPDIVVAVGGGSVLDTAKLVNALAHQEAEPLAIVQGREQVRVPGVPLIAVPTTAGSGSEATHFAVVYVERSKYSLASPLLLPKAAIVDPALTFSLTPRLTAVTGMDAFAQAVESYWSVHSTDGSKACARRAIELVLRWLPRAVHEPTPEARRSMSKAAHLAGRAINITKTTGAHAMSYPLTMHFGIPHGHAVCLTLGRWLLFNSQVSDADVTDPRGARYVQQTVAELVTLMGCLDAEGGCRRIEELTCALGLQPRLGSLGISRPAAIDAVVPNVNVERVANNPRAPTPSSLRQLVEAVC
jgi:alcohol dehydrogenase class IV